MVSHCVRPPEDSDAWSSLRAPEPPPSSAHVGRIEYLVGDSYRRRAPESRGLQALLFLAIGRFRTEPLKSLAIGRSPVQHRVDGSRQSRQLVVGHHRDWYPLAEPALRNPSRDTF